GQRERGGCARILDAGVVLEGAGVEILDRAMGAAVGQQLAVDGEARGGQAVAVDRGVVELELGGGAGAHGVDLDGAAGGADVVVEVVVEQRRGGGGAGRSGGGA